MNLTYFYLPALFLIHVEMKDLLTPTELTLQIFMTTQQFGHILDTFVFLCVRCVHVIIAH